MVYTANSITKIAARGMAITATPLTRRGMLNHSARRLFDLPLGWPGMEKFHLRRIAHRGDSHGKLRQTAARADCPASLRFRQTGSWMPDLKVKGSFICRYSGK